MIEHLAYVPHNRFLNALARGWLPERVRAAAHHDCHSYVMLWAGPGEPDMGWRRGKMKIYAKRIM